MQGAASSRCLCCTLAPGNCCYLSGASRGTAAGWATSTAPLPVLLGELAARGQDRIFWILSHKSLSQTPHVHMESLKSYGWQVFSWNAPVCFNPRLIYRKMQTVSQCLFALGSLGDVQQNLPWLFIHLPQEHVGVPQSAQVGIWNATRSTSRKEDALVCKIWNKMFIEEILDWSQINYNCQVLFICNKSESFTQDS